MVEIVGPSSKTKTNLYKMISKVIQKKHYISKHKIKFDKYLKDSIKNLKRINLIETRSGIEMSKYKSTEYLGFLWQEKINETYHFFASVIDLFDGYLKHNIEFNSNFDSKSCKEEIEEDIRKQLELLTIRNDVLKEFKNRNTEYSPIMLEKALETVPSYRFFDELYNNTIEYDYQLNLQVELIITYNIGYTSFGYCNFYGILDLYRGLIEGLKHYEQLNHLKLDDVRNKVISKSVNHKNI